MADSPNQAQGDGWGTRIGVILAVAGSAVGLGNFLRFPGQAAANGGGAFMIPYFVSLLVLGIPLCWAEWTMGRAGGLRGFNSAPGIYRKIGGGRFSMYFGVIALMLPLVIYMYYVLIEAWCLSYALQYLSGDLIQGAGGKIDQLAAKAAEAMPDASNTAVLSQAFQDFFDRFVGIKKDGFALGGANSGWLWVIPATFLLNFVLIYRGISGGIEKFCRIAMPVMAVLAMIVLVRVLTLGTPDPAGNPNGNVWNGLGFMWNPRGSGEVNYLLRPETWLAASGQIFFSLSVGFGIIINYASYLKRNDDVVLSGLTSSSMNEFFEVCLGGMITLPAAFIFLGAAAGGMGTFGLGFIALPNVFAMMPGGQLVGFLWFFMLFLAAITSSVSMLQPVIAFLEEGFGLKRHASVALLGLISAMGASFVLYFSEGLVALDMFDFWIGTFAIYILAMFQTILYGWVLGIRRGEAEAHEGAHMRIPRVVQYLLKFVTPAYLIVIFAAFCWDSLPSKFEPVTTVASVELSALSEGALPPAVRAALTSAEQELPAEVEVRKSSSLWSGEQAKLFAPGAGEEGEDQLLYLARPAEEGTGIVVGLLNKGRIANVLASTSSCLSIGFLVLLALFLLLMVHIAGLRWEKAGLFRSNVATE